MSEKALAVVLLDASGVLHKCFHGYTDERLAVVDGKRMDVAAVYGYLDYVRKLTKEIEYDVLIHVLDPDGGSHHRFTLFPEYKGQRSSTHPVLSAQKTLLPRVLEAFGQNVIQKHGIESDDILGTLANKYADAGHDVLVVSQDKDLFQLVKNGRIMQARYLETERGKSKTHVFYEEQDVVETFGVRPDQIADFLALVGDVSDNIPGVAGVAGKTAAKLLGEHGTLNAILTNAEQIKGAIGKNIRDAKDKLPLYRQLTGLLTELDIPLVFDRPEIDIEKSVWVRKMFPNPAWPDDLVGDLLPDSQPEFSTPRPRTP